MGEPGWGRGVGKALSCLCDTWSPPASIQQPCFLPPLHAVCLGQPLLWVPPTTNCVHLQETKLHVAHSVIPSGSKRVGHLVPAVISALHTDEIQLDTDSPGEHSWFLLLEALEAKFPSMLIKSQ